MKIAYRASAVLSALFVALAWSNAALAQKSFLKTNEFLKQGEYLVADNKSHFAIMQGDGNFCVYKGSGPGDNKGNVYCAGTHGGGASHFAIIQGDGNFCIYRGTGPAANKGFGGCTNSAKGMGSYFAIMQGDGNFVVYRGTGPGDNKGLVWDRMSAQRSGGGVSGFFNSVGAGLKVAANATADVAVDVGNAVGDAFKGKPRASRVSGEVKVGGASVDVTVTGKEMVSVARVVGTGGASVSIKEPGKYLDIVNHKYVYSIRGTKAGPVTVVFQNGVGEDSVSFEVIPAPPPPPPAPAFTRAKSGVGFITTNQYLREGDFLLADNKAYFAYLQGDGNFCVYRGSGPGDNKGNVFCLPGRDSGAGQYFAAVQADGNFCTYRGTGPGDNKGNIYCSGSARAQNAYFLIMQGDGNLAVYAGTGPGDNKGLVWNRK